MTDSRYAPIFPPPSGHVGPAGRRSPTYNPARLSMPTTVGSGAPSSGAYSLYSGPVPLLSPPHQPHQQQHQQPHQQPHPPPHPQPHQQPQHPRPQQHPHPQQQPHQQPAPPLYDRPIRRQTNPMPVPLYPPSSKEAMPRSASLRQPGAPTSASNSSRQRRTSTIEPPSQRPVIVAGNAASRPHPSRNDRSPTRDPFRSSEEFYAQPASSIPSRAHRRSFYSATVDEQDLARFGNHGDVRPNDGPVYASMPARHEPVPEEGYEYYRPSDLARYDLDNPPRQTPGSSRRRRESLDRDNYYRPSVVVNSGYDRSRPPPTTRGLDKVPHAPAPAPPAIYEAPSARMPTGPPSRELPAAAEPSRRIASDSHPMNPPVSMAVAGRKERPSSMYHGDQPYHHRQQEYHPTTRDDGRHRQERRDADHDEFHDDNVRNRGFGIRTDDVYDPATTYRRPGREYPGMPPPEPRRRLEGSPERYNERDRPRDRDRERQRDMDRDRERERKREVERQRDRRQEPAFEYVSRKPPHKNEDWDTGQKVAAGSGAASVADAAAAMAGEDSHRRHRSPEDERRRDRKHEPQSRDHSQVRDEAADKKSRADSRQRKPESTKKPEETRKGDVRFSGDSPSSSGQLTPTTEDEKEVGLSSSQPKRRPRATFKPNDPADLKDIQAHVAEFDDKTVATTSSKETEASSSSSSNDPQRSGKQSKDTTPPEDNDKLDEESRGREVAIATADDGGGSKQVRVVSPPREKRDSKPLRGILKAPKEKFPEERNPIREGVAPHKDDKSKKDTPPGARWTKIRRDIVNPEALEAGKERYEVRDNFVIVLRVLNKEEIEQYAYATQLIRESRDSKQEKDYDRDYDQDRDHGKDDRGREWEQEEKRHQYTGYKRDDKEEDRRYRDADRDRNGEREREPRTIRDNRERERERDREVEKEKPRRHRTDLEGDRYDGQGAIEYHAGGGGGGYRRGH